MTQSQENYVRQFDPLDAFATWFLQQPVGTILSQAPKDGLISYGKVIGLCLYRQDEFQVELFMTTERGGFPKEHCHPNVDSYEVHVSGNIFLTVNGQPSAERSVVESARQDGSSPLAGIPTRVRPNDWHGAHEDSDGAFLSIQRWMNGVRPTSVGLDWEGEYTHDVHAKQAEERGNSAEDGITSRNGL